VQNPEGVTNRETVERVEYEANKKQEGEEKKEREATGEKKAQVRWG